MRNVLIVLTLLAIGGFLYSHQDLWLKALAPAAASSPAPAATPPIDLTQGAYAVQLWGRNNTNGPFLYQVAVVSGERWRSEAKQAGTMKTLVAVCDGSRTVSNLGPQFPAARMDPRPEMDPFLKESARLTAAAATLPASGTEQCDGHTCWKTTVSFGGMSLQLWSDTATGFPVYATGIIRGRYLEEHFRRIPIDFSNPGTAEFFDPAHTESIFARFLRP